MYLFSDSTISLEIIKLSQLFLIFILYSFIGWCSEVMYVGIFHEHKFVNRGFLYGPICPIYGFGGIVIMFVPQLLKSNLISLFFVSMVLCSIVEYIASFWLEKTFKMKWWDYSNYKFNINGRVCLLNSILFGIMGVVVINFVQPFIDKIIFSIQDYVAIYLAFFISIIFIIDNILTLQKLLNFSVAMAKLKEFSESLKSHYENEAWFRSSSISEMFNSIKERVNLRKELFNESMLKRIDKFNRLHLDSERFITRFPKVSSRTYKDALALVKEHIAKKVSEKKQK